MISTYFTLTKISVNFDFKIANYFERKLAYDFDNKIINNSF